MNACKHGKWPSQGDPECLQCRDQGYKDEIAKLHAEVEGLKQELVKGLPSLKALRQIDVLQDENGRLEGRLKDVDLQKDRLLKAANDLLGKIGGPTTPVDPVWEDEFAELDILVGEMRITNEKRKPLFILCSGCGSQQKDCKCT